MVISWALLQAADIIFPLLGIEDSVLRVILVVLTIGFPIWILFAYFFEWTNEGFKLTSQVEEGQSISKSTSRRLNHYIIGGLVLAVILLVADRITNFSGTMPTKVKERSIAVLPFDNLGDPETAYFAEGMAEDILTQLSKVADLRVLSRVTLKGYDASGKTVEEIGDDLGVNYLLTGSVRKANEQVRVTCQLVQVNPEEQTWAENFDRQLNDIFRIQSEVAQNITSQLQSNLSPDEKRRIELEPTQNLEAYTLYLRGRDAYNQYTGASMQEAASLFKEAITEDPNLALAYAGLADAYSQLANFEVLPRSYFDSALVAGQKSIALNPELSEGWKAIGLVYNYQGDLINAQKHYEKALEFNPNFHPAIANLVPVYGRQGNIDKAMKTALRSMQANPLNSFSYTNISEGLKFLGMYDSAIAINKRGLEVTESYSIYRMQSEIYTDLGEIDLAKANFQKMLEMDSNPGYLITAAAIAVRLDTALSKEILGMIPELAQSQGEKYWSAYSTLSYLIQETYSAQDWIDSGIDA